MKIGEVYYSFHYNHSEKRVLPLAACCVRFVLSLTSGG
jgi:hypothetical protein